MSSPSHPQSPGDPAGPAQPSTAEIPVVQPAAAPVTKQLPPHPGATAFGAHPATGRRGAPADRAGGLRAGAARPRHPAAAPARARSRPRRPLRADWPETLESRRPEPGRRGRARARAVRLPAGPQRPGRGGPGRARAGPAAARAGARLRHRVAVGRRPAVVGVRHGRRPGRAAGPARRVLARRAGARGPGLAGGRRGPGRPGGVLAAAWSCPVRTATAVSCSPPRSAASAPRCGSAPSAPDPLRRAARPSVGLLDALAVVGVVVSRWSVDGASLVVVSDVEGSSVGAALDVGVAGSVVDTGASVRGGAGRGGGLRRRRSPSARPSSSTAAP